MARPSKNIEEKKIHLTYVRLTPTERALLLEEAKLEDYTLSDFIRSKIFKAYNSQIRKDPEKRKILIELTRIGVNLNQIAKAVNSGIRPELINFVQSLLELRLLLKHINKKHL